MRSKVRLGIIGCGAIGKFHLRYASEQPDIRVVAVADLHLDEARRIAHQVGVSAVYADGMDLIEDPVVDAVVLAVPTALRFDLALAALARKKHVLLEKPAAMHVSQIKALMEAQGDCVIATCSSRNRGMMSARAATDFIASGALGEIRLLHCRAIAFSHALISAATPKWRLRKSYNGGGIFANWGSYDLDFLLGICGWTLMPRLVMARTWIPPQHLPFQSPIVSDVESHVAAMICCDNQAVIHYERAESSASSLPSTWQIIGSRGALTLNLLPQPSNRVVFDSVDGHGQLQSQVIWEGNDEEDAIHAAPVANFAESILREQPPLTGPAEALVIQAITDAVYASADSGCAVAIDQDFSVHIQPAVPLAAI